MGRHAVALLIGAVAAAGTVAAITPGRDVLVPAAARAGTWVTDLYVLNPGPAPAAVTVQWLLRRQPNPAPESVTLEVAAGATAVLEDVILDRFGLPSGEGAFRVVADREVVVNARIFSQQGDATLGQGFEGVPAALAVAAGRATDVVGLAANGRFRTNLYALAGPDGATLVMSLRDADGVELAARSYTLGAYEPVLGNVLTELGGPLFDHGSLHVEVAAGAAVVGASKVDSASLDPTTLASWWPCGEGDAQEPAGVYYGSVALAGRERGFTLTLNELAEVVALQFEMGSTRPGCLYLFPAERVFDPPLPLAEVLSAAGVRFVVPYSGSGQIEWTVRLVEGTRYLHYSGSLSGFASGSPGSSECDGPTGDGQVRLGKQPL